jgi:hypothetical protein
MIHGHDFQRSISRYGRHGNFASWVHPTSARQLSTAHAFRVVLPRVRICAAIAANGTLHINMSIKKNRIYTGVSLEPQVTDYLNDLAKRMGMSRSWVLNTIVQEYARYIEDKNIQPLSSREAAIRL